MRRHCGDHLKPLDMSALLKFALLGLFSNCTLPLKERDITCKFCSVCKTKPSLSHKARTHFGTKSTISYRIICLVFLILTFQACLLVCHTRYRNTWLNWTDESWSVISRTNPVLTLKSKAFLNSCFSHYLNCSPPSSYLFQFVIFVQVCWSFPCSDGGGPLWLSEGMPSFLRKFYHYCWMSQRGWRLQGG